jgi:DNA-binding response OmpR family regulator
VTANCPTCKQPVPSLGLYVDAGRGVVVRNDEAATLTRKEFEIFDLLRRRAPRVVEYNDIYGALYDDLGDDVPMPDGKCIAVLVCKLRDKLAPLGLKVKPSFMGRPPAPGVRAGYFLEKI